MTGSIKIRDYVFLFASILMAVSPMLPIVTMYYTLNGKLTQKSFSMFNNIQIGIAIVFISVLSVFLMGYLRKVVIAGVLQILNALFYLIGSAIIIDFCNNSVNSKDLVFLMATVMSSNSTYDLVCKVEPGYYIGCGVAVFIIPVCIYCILMRNKE